MTRLAFTVDPTGGALIDQCYIGFSFGGIDNDGGEHTLDLICDPDFTSDAPAWGPFLEHDGRESRQPGIIACRLSRERLSLDLSAPFAGRTDGPVGFDLTLSRLGEERYRELVAILPSALRGVACSLRIA